MRRTGSTAALTMAIGCLAAAAGAAAAAVTWRRPFTRAGSSRLRARPRRAALPGYPRRRAGHEHRPPGSVPRPGRKRHRCGLTQRPARRPPQRPARRPRHRLLPRPAVLPRRTRHGHRHVPIGHGRHGLRSARRKADQLFVLRRARGERRRRRGPPRPGRPSPLGAHLPVADVQFGYAPRLPGPHGDDER